MSLFARIVLFVFTFVCAAATATAGETEDLAGLLDHFLEHVSDVKAHERFWADDLVYTSSNGERTTKAAILASVAESADDADPGPTYTAEDVDVRIYGAMGIVAFRLVATPPDDSGDTQYFNTGTFLKRGDVWQVVAWQATRILK